MADEQATADVSQADTDAGSQVEQESVSTQAAGTKDTETVSPERYRKVVSEARGLRERLKQYEEKETQALPEVERLQKERDKLDSELTELRQEIRTGRITSAAVKAGALYPDAVVRLVPDDADDYERAIKEVQKAYPALFPRGNADGGAATGTAQTNQLDMNTLIRQAAGRG